MIERTGNLFDSESNYLAHGVNCQGAMGAGIAKQFREYFPDNYREYRRLCDDKILQPGGVYVGEGSPFGENKKVVNLASQNQLGPDASYDWLFSALFAFAEKASDPRRLKHYGGTVAINEIGCGIGGLQWPKVKSVLNTIEFIFPDIEFEVWHYGG